MTDELIDLDEFRTQVRAWLDENMEPVEPGFAAMAEDPSPDEIAASRDLQQKLFDAGYAQITYPVEYGGAGLSHAHERVFGEEARNHVMPDFGGAGHVMFSAIGRSLLAHCPPDFLARHIPPLLSGRALWCQFYSEPEAGSDLAGIRTRAERDGDTWVITGSKIWSTGAQNADWAMCLARTDWSVPKHSGLTWFAVPTDAPGVSVRPIRQINGASGFCEAFLDEVTVSDDDMIGELNQGWTVAQTMLVYERGAGGARLTEPTRVAPDLVALARELGKADDPVVRQKIARAHINDYARFHLAKRLSARMRASATPQPGLASYAKLAGGVGAPIRARLALEIGGPDVLSWQGDPDGELPLHVENYLNARMGAIAAGTNEMMRNGISERVLGLPREPSFDSRTPFSEVVKRSRNWDGRVG